MTTPRAFDRGHVQATLLGHSFRFATGHGLFSADRVDDGTRLLLEHLPPGAPASVLDMGCGYGALGLPVAATHPGARVVLVDRDLLAVVYAGRNAHDHGLTNVVTRPSLGYRDIDEERFDWVLCNIPARIGTPAIGYLMGAGAQLLTPSGELRVVVINDLCGPVESLGLNARLIARGPRHTIYALGPRPHSPVDHEGLYARDEVTLPTLKLRRAHDLSEDPSHLKEGLPLLLDVLPKSPKGRALVMRGGYGAAAITLAQRGASVVAADRDLLALTFTRINAQAHNVVVESRPALWLPAALTEPFSVVIGELSTTAGDAVAKEEARAAAALRRGTEVLWLTLSKHANTWLTAGDKKLTVAASKLATRGAWTVLRLSPSGA